ncbi:MAG: hypothetical protein EZS28_020608 [Streblomastix strix]|uniref:Uncharacterized protein n=1 Tax=Streblomastix strix TaxID=222440 RepID=A0A5J4VN39_9EUKA|nr:MAG: hypothetical protein EZS28_020608 [Streblomastix strix]
MGFFSGIANIGSKILGGIKQAAQWVAPTLHKVLSTISGPVGMIHPGIGGALVYAANNQIVDGYATDYALKIAPSGLLTIKNLKVINFDFVAQINNGDIVPDQVTPASDAIPSNSVVNGSAGVSNEYTRGDHQPSLQISTVLPAKDTTNGEEGVATTYDRSDHTHHVNQSNDLPLKDTGTGTAGTANVYASATHQHPLNVDPTTANVPLVNATAAAYGTSDIYSRNNHVHPQQLTYDGNITATKFIKTGGLATEILCANGDMINGVVDIATDQTINGRKAFKNNQFETQLTAGTPLLINWRGSSLSSQFPESKLIQNYVLNAGTLTSFAGVTSGNIQINPTATSYDDGLRIARSGENSGNSSIQLGCNRTYNTGLIEGQLSIFTPPNTAVTNPQSLILAVASQAGDNIRDQTLAGIKTFHKLVQVIPSANGTFNEGIRISRHPSNQWSNIQFGSDPNSNSGKIDNQWLVGSTGNNGANPLGFVIVKARQEGQADRGLQISADGNTLTFNDQVIAGNGAPNHSVNYSQGNPILWGTKSLGTDGGFYSDGTTVFWRDHALQFDPYYQNQ